MRKIKQLVELIDEELEGAQTYAEKYVEYKAEDDSTWANRFKQMSNDELNHANYIHELAVKTIDSISKVYAAPLEMQEKWDKCHEKYVEKASQIKQMLTL